MEQIVFNITQQMKIVSIIGNIIFQILLLTLNFLEGMVCSCRFLSGYWKRNLLPPI